MEAPETFRDRLNRLFDGRLRIRWSHARGEWQIEQKVARGQVAPYFVSEHDDDLIRARDGYGFVLAVRPGDRMPCPVCGFAIKVPVMQAGEAICPYCRLHGKDGRYSAAYYPLDGDLLLDRLKFLDPVRGYRDGVIELIEARNEAITRQKERDLANHIEASTKDNWNQIAEIPQWGYTGREKAWIR